jgi:glycosyltransferase involved in cell wall biosynthesis
MKILHFIYDHIHNPWVGGGGAVRAYEICRRLSARHHITVICGKFPGANDYREGNLNFHFVGSRKNNYILGVFCYAAGASNFLKSNRDAFDIVIEDFAPYNPLFSFVRREDAIIQVHQKEGIRHIIKYNILGLPFLCLETFYPRLFKNFIAISDMSRQKFGLRGQGIVVPNGFDSGLLGQDSLERDFVLYLGRLHINQKGLDVLRDALRQIAVKVYIAGSGKDEPKVQKLFGEFTGSGIVEMVGFVSGQKKAGLLGNCKFVVMPSRYEGQPLTLVEAAACGKPVIVSDIPELRYAVDAGFGISFKTGDAEDLAGKIKLLLGNEPMRREMGKKAREYAEKFTWDKIAEEYEEFLLKVAHIG